MFLCRSCDNRWDHIVLGKLHGGLMKAWNLLHNRTQSCFPKKASQVELLYKFLLQILGQTKRTAKENHMIKVHLPILLAESEKEQQVIRQFMMSESH